MLHARIGLHCGSDGKWWWRASIALEGTDRHTVSLFDSIEFPEREEAAEDAQCVLSQLGIVDFDFVN